MLNIGMELEKKLGHLVDFIKDKKCPNGPSEAKLKSQTKPCEDCGLIVTDRIVHKRVYRFRSKSEWRVQCRSCMCWQDPEGKFTITNDVAPSVFSKRFKK